MGAIAFDAIALLSFYPMLTGAKTPSFRVGVKHP